MLEHHSHEYVWYPFYDVVHLIYHTSKGGKKRWCSVVVVQLRAVQDYGECVLANGDDGRQLALVQV